MMEMKPAWKACIKADDRANESYEAAITEARKEWETAVAPATEIYNIAVAKAWNDCQEAKTRNFETFNPQGSIFVVGDKQ